MENTKQSLREFRAYLESEERSAGTVEKYLRDVSALVRWLCGASAEKERIAQWRDALLEDHKPGTVNSMLASVNAYLRFMGAEEQRVKTLRVQRRMFRAPERELTRGEYERLVSTARAGGKVRLALMLETICATGIRVSELRYITVEAARVGRAEIRLKGKIRTILLPGKLCRKLKKYAEKQKTASGEIFLTRSGRPLGRKQIWAEMKALCAAAGVEASKVFPHNLRHLFACMYYRSCRDIVQLADILGHSNIETTRVYLISSGEEHKKRMERLRLIA